MSSSVIRVSSGEVIQVRTGTLQGIGPQGPIGLTGPQGPIGLTGATGPIGPMGQVNEYSSLFKQTSQFVATTTITNNLPTSYTAVSFPNIDHDDMAAQATASTYKLPVGDYCGWVSLRFEKQASTNASGFRAAQVIYNGVAITEDLRNASATTHTTFTLPFAMRVSDATQILSVQVAHNEGVSLNVYGSLWINRTGPGQQGIQGPIGQTGPAGPTGPQGPIGPAGSLVTNTTTLQAIGGTE